MGTRLIGIGITLLAGAGITAVVAGTGSFDDNTERNDNGEIIDGGGLGAFRVEIGDCINLPDEAAIGTDPTAEATEVVSVEGVPCDESHDAQAYAKFDITDLTVYSEWAAGRRADEGCVDRWTAAIGTNFWQDQELTIYTLFPSDESWRLLFDRNVTCFLTAIDGTPLVGSRLVADRG